MAKQNILEMFPTETLVQVFSYLTNKDLKSARLTCRAFYACSTKFLIVDRVVVARRWGTLERLEQIIEHPFYSQTITTVVVDLSTFVKEMTKKGEYVRKFKQMTMPNTPSLVRGSPNWTPLMKGLQKYRQLYREQEQFRLERDDLGFLFEALQTFPNVKEIVFDDDPRHDSFLKDIGTELGGWCLRPKNLWDHVDKRYALDRFMEAREVISYAAPPGILTYNPNTNLPTSSGASPPIAFPKLEAISIDCSFFWTESFDLDVFASAETNQDAQTERLAALGNIKRLNLTYRLYNGDANCPEYAHNLSSSRGNDNLHGRDHLGLAYDTARRARARLSRGGLANLTSLSPALEHLRLDFGATGDNLPAFNNIHNPLPNLLMEAIIGRDPTRPYALKSLEIIGLGLDARELVDLLILHASTLKSVSLHDVGIRRGRWANIVLTLKGLGLESLSIQNIWGWSVNKRLDNRWCALTQTYCLYQGDAAGLRQELINQGYAEYQISGLIGPNGEYRGPA